MFSSPLEVEVQRQPLQTALASQREVRRETDVKGGLPVPSGVPFHPVAYATRMVEQDIRQSGQLVQRQRPGQARFLARQTRGVDNRRSNMHYHELDFPAAVIADP